MKLYGTMGSPFVRRVRVVAAELGEPVELVMTGTDEGQAVLREVSPIRKVPVAICDGTTVFDSRTIVEWLTASRGWGNIAPPAERWRDANLVNALDGALDGIVQAFYLKRDGAEAQAYTQRQRDRADAVFAWLGTQVAADGRSFGGGFGLAEISVVCTLDWIDARSAHPLEHIGALAGVRAAWRDRPSMVATRPPA
jgi:glutathione S-transferase